MFGRPSFEAYPILAMQVGATMVQVPLTAAHRYDLDAMVDAVTDRTRLVFVCNPNNPTGTSVDRDAVDRFLDRVPDDLLVVFDEAYREFVTAPELSPTVSTPSRGMTTSRCCARSRRRTGSLRSASATRSRPKSVIDALRKVRVPFEVNALAQVAASASLAARRRDARPGRRRDRASARDSPTPWPTSACPSCHRTPTSCGSPLPEQAAVLGEYSERAGVVLRPFPGSACVSPSARRENDRLLKVLRAAVGGRRRPANRLLGRRRPMTPRSTRRPPRRAP